MRSDVDADALVRMPAGRYWTRRSPLQVRSSECSISVEESGHERAPTDLERCLRRILARYVPPALFDGPKAGFGIPLAPWLRGPLKDSTKNLPSNDRLWDANAAELLGYTFGETAGAIWQQHASGRRNREHELRSFLMYQAWHEAWVK